MCMCVTAGCSRPGAIVYVMSGSVRCDIRETGGWRMLDGLKPCFLTVWEGGHLTHTNKPTQTHVHTN